MEAPLFLNLDSRLMEVKKQGRLQESPEPALIGY